MLRTILALLVVLVLFVGGGFYYAYRGAVFSVALEEKIVALTYDDGPNPPHTRALLKMLEQHQVKATFFPKGRNVEAFPETLRAVVEAGHEIGNHSYFHHRMTTLYSAEMLAELKRSNALIAQVQGFEPTLFRPPYGAQGIGLKRAIDELEMTSVLMSATGFDWEHTDARQIADAALEKIEPGAIVLLHDGHGDVDDPDTQDSRAPTVVATGIIIETLRAQGYSFVTVGELLAGRGN